MLQVVVRPIKLVLSHRTLIAHSVASELRYRTAGTILGKVWLILNPLLLLLVYSIVYLAVFKVKPPSLSETEYVVYIFCGLVPFLGMAEGVNAGVSSVSNHAALLSSTVFPVDVLPVRAVLASQSGFVAGIVVVLICATIWGKPSPWWILLPLLVGLQVAWLIGLAWILSVANLLVRDLQNLVAFMITVFMVLSPIAFTSEMLPPVLKPLIWINPFAYFVLAYQSILMLGEGPSVSHGIAILASSIALFAFGFVVFNRLRVVVSDHA
jgi:lipopolysaccharide transport system permease protein